LSPHLATELQRWLNACRERLSAAPEPSRRPLRLAGEVVGSVNPEMWPQIEAHWPSEGSPDETLAQLAHHLRASGLAGVWRNERVAVRGTSGAPLAAVERGVVRVLGIRTEAVHLVGLAPDGRVWLQQRAFDKADDPGRWDTMVGGLVAWGESRGEALARETWEEAGLVLADLQPGPASGVFHISKPVPEPRSMGHMLEAIHWQVATLQEGMQPVNQDGEVACFEAVPPEGVARRVLEGSCTDEAAWILALALGWWQ
jgi:8-oxo-dGTP pyrophosphatase MutT (NUDIX family)